MKFFENHAIVAPSILIQLPPIKSNNFERMRSGEEKDERGGRDIKFTLVFSFWGRVEICLIGNHVLGWLDSIHINHVIFGGQFWIRYFFIVSSEGQSCEKMFPTTVARDYGQHMTNLEHLFHSICGRRREIQLFMHIQEHGGVRGQFQLYEI